MTFQLVYNERPAHSPDSKEGRRYWQTFLTEQRAKNRAVTLNEKIKGPGMWLPVEVGG